MESEGDADVRRHEGESEEFVRTRGGGSAVRLRFRGRELGGGVRLDVGTEWRVSDRIGTEGMRSMLIQLGFSTSGHLTFSFSGP